MPFTVGRISVMLMMRLGQGYGILVMVVFRFTKESLGHKSSKTTEIYTHDSGRDIGRIQSPSDSLLAQQKGRLRRGFAN